ncbi:hypothetical protein [Corynebacterium nasicanis]|uniref:Uncharacterized protein n=1 Tax=Corynebacterium nasicanis TaxID=1448267 RepID=A0ABW1QE71_9CORY
MHPAATLGVGAAVLAYSLIAPLFGLSLLAFLLIDAALLPVRRARRRRRRG